MSKAFPMVCSLILSLVVTPVSAQNNVVNMRLDGKTYSVQLNGVFAKVCAAGRVQLTDFAFEKEVDGSSPPLLGGVSNGAHIPLVKIKMGEQLGAVTLSSTTNPFPFDLDLKDAKVTRATVRSNGTWTMTVGWSSCTNRPKKK